MKTKTKHSPLPWHINAGTINGRADYQIYSDEANRTPIAQLIQNQRHTIADVEANAALIVRACNNVQRLVDALTDCETSPGALAERSHEFALRRLAAITQIAREALAQWEKAK